MHCLQAWLFENMTVAAFRIYLSMVKMQLKPYGEVEGHVLKSHGNYIVDRGNNGKIMELCF